MISLFEAAVKLSIVLSEEQQHQFDEYREKIIKLPHNLTAIREPDGIVVRHFLDSLVILKYFDLDKSKKFCDVGSGAGFPLMPVKIVRPEIDATFIDSRQKSIGFLDELIHSLGLTKCRTVHGHTSQLRKEFAGRFDYVLVRAFGSVAKVLEDCLFLLRRGGSLFLYKGPKYTEELSLVPKSLLAQTSAVEPKDVEVPFLGEKRVIVRIAKA